LPCVQEGATHVYHIYMVRSKQRDALQQFLQEQGVGTLIHYPIPPHLQKAYVHLEYKKGAFPIAEEIAATCLSLPLWPGMQSTQVEDIARKIKLFYEKNPDR